jgi:ribonuclease Y
MSGVLGLLAIGLLAAVLIAILVVGYLVVTRVVRRRHDATANSEQNVSAIAQVELDEAHRQAGDIRKRAETEAADVRTKAQTIADQAQQARREAEEEARQLKEDLRELRLDLERREHGSRSARSGRIPTKRW